MPSDTGGGIIIIRRKLKEKVEAVKSKVRPWHVFAAIGLAFILGAVIF